MTLQQVCEKEFDGNITPEMLVEFSFSGEETDNQLEYLDELLETNGNTDVEWYNVPDGHFIKVILKKED